ncbi:hypothetical protein [Streptomyces scabiei]|uniref:hypothetical protein n=1 Tax=Streptomyces scabiei TaxID=1930 RepID=UPI0007661216|nr:hypothetical protein [Streptomyces scabiei]MDX2835443.1 hypothetical protein [Streptomyces scabiei]
MTAHRDEPGPADPTDRELMRHYEAFTAKIEAALDVEAGLRDILFQSRHEAFMAKVETALGVEAGLRDILMPPTTQAPPSIPAAIAPPVVNAAPGGSRWQASPAQRLKLRSNPRVAAASRVLRAVGNWASASPRARDLDFDLAHDLARARDLARALAQARGLDFDLTRDLARARDLARDLARARGLARDIDVAHAHDLAHALDLARARALALALARDLALAHALARDIDVAHAHDLAHARDLALARDLARDLALDLALDRALDLAHALAHAHDRTLDRTRYRCLQIINNEYTQAVGALVAVDEESLASLMDDFTTDDLSNADVREDDIKLTGVRWSDATTWPASTDIYRLKRRSDRQEDGSWIIREGTGNVRKNILT